MAYSGRNNAVLYSAVPSAMKFTFESEAIFRVCIAIFFLMSLVVPTTHQDVRGVFLLFMMLLLFIWYLYRGAIYLSSEIFCIYMIGIILSISMVFYGILMGAPGAVRVASVFILWPAVFIFFMASTRKILVYELMMKTVVVGAFIASCMGILLVFDELFKLGMGILSLFASQGAVVEVYTSSIEYRLYNITTVIYGLPFLIGVLMLDSKLSLFQGRWRFFCFLTLFLCLVCLLISGRRAFMLVAMLAPFIALTICWLGRARTRFARLALWSVPLGLVLLLAIAPQLGLDLGAMIGSVGQAFDEQSEVGAATRLDQARILLSYWAERPLLGQGLGASAPEIIRDPEMPWAYELSYVALLFQTGLIGFLIYSLMVMYIYIRGIQLMRRCEVAIAYFVPLLTALTCFLIANATNPYLAKFDYLWTIFFPVGVINVCLLNRKYTK